MKGIKKAVSITICLVMLLSMMACQKNVSEPTGNTNQNEQATGDKNTINPVPDKLDNGNIKVLSWMRTDLDDNADAIKEFEQKYGGKVEYTFLANWMEAETKLATDMAAGESYDVIPWGVAKMPTYALKNILQPIDQYFNMKDPLIQPNIKAMDMIKYKDQYYGLRTGVIPRLIGYNKTMFQKYGVKTPTEYYNEGKWDWNALKECGMKLTKDLDGDGSKDIYGFTTGDVNYFLITNNIGLLKLDKNGVPSLALDDPKFVESLQFLQDAIFKDKWMVWNKNADFIAGKAAMGMGQFNGRIDSPFKDLKDEWDIVPFPVGPNGTKDVTYAMIDSVGIGNGTKNPKGGAAYIYMCLKHDSEQRQNNYSKYLSKNQIDLVNKIAKNSIIDISPCYRIDTNKLYNDVRAGQPVSTSIEKYRPEYKAALDDMLSQMK